MLVTFGPTFAPLGKIKIWFYLQCSNDKVSTNIDTTANLVADFFKYSLLQL